MKSLIYFGIALALIFADQAFKLYIHYSLPLEGDMAIFGDWFKLHYTLNPGMAFGIEIGSHYGKLGLTLFRTVAVLLIGYSLWLGAVRNYHKGLLVCGALILGGALGNVIDSVFYGVFIENNAVIYKDGFTPPFYPWFHGQVIDMFYFDIWKGYFPASLPLIGGSYYSFFPIFNIADAGIFCGVVSILIWHKTFFPHEEEAQSTASETQDDAQNPDEVQAQDDNPTL
jgi:signal peptidase II